MEKRIYYHDTDAGGVVYYGRYLNYLEEARTELLESKGVDIDLFRTQEFLYAVRQCSITYKSPDRYGDTIKTTTEITKISAAQITFDQQIHVIPENRLILQAEVTVVSLTKEFKPTPIPDNIREKLS